MITNAIKTHNYAPTVRPTKRNKRCIRIVLRGNTDGKLLDVSRSIRSDLYRCHYRTFRGSRLSMSNSPSSFPLFASLYLSFRGKRDFINFWSIASRPARLPSRRRRITVTSNSNPLRLLRTRTKFSACVRSVRVPLFSFFTPIRLLLVRSPSAARDAPRKFSGGVT